MDCGQRNFGKTLLIHFGASKTLTQIDGEEHRKMRTIMRKGFSREAGCWKIPHAH
jgi:cytochrome P450